MLLCRCHDHALRLLTFGAWTVILGTDRLAISCAGGIIGPYLIGALSDKYSYGAAMITLGAFNLLAALLFTTFPGEGTCSQPSANP